MPKNRFSTILQQYLKLTKTKNTTLAKAVQYDLSYISKWLGGSMLPSERNAEEVIARITECLLDGECESLLPELHCERDELADRIKSELKKAFDASRPIREENQIHAVQPIHDIVAVLENKLRDSADVAAVMDLLALPREYRLILAEIQNGHFVNAFQPKKYALVIHLGQCDCVYDSIFLIHMLTSLSGIDFKLYRNEIAAGKIIFCMDESAVTSLLLPGSKDGIAVNVLTNGMPIRQSISPFISQDTLIFRDSTIQEMISNRDYIQTMISTNIRWILGHATELFLPQDVFEELMAEDTRDTTEYMRLYRLSQNVIRNGAGRFMIYESAISDLAVDGIVDFYNRPVKLKPTQVIKCLEYYRDLVEKKCPIRLIDGGFSDDFRYITNPCMFLSDSMCYLRLENQRYMDNILILNDRVVKELFHDFFDRVWSDRPDVVAEDASLIREKIEHYIRAAGILTAT